jgi:hypothetical protein
VYREVKNVRSDCSTLDMTSVWKVQNAVGVSKSWRDFVV